MDSAEHRHNAILAVSAGRNTPATDGYAQTQPVLAVMGSL